MRDGIRLSVEELFLLWWAADLGDPPPVLDLPRRGATSERRARYAAEASAALEARGLGTVAEPVPALAAVLRRLATADIRLDLRGYGPDGPWSAFGACTERKAAVAWRAGNDVVVATVTPGQLVESLLATLPPLPAPPGLSANVHTADYADACSHGERTGTPGFLQVLRSAGLRGPEAATVARAVTTRQGGGQLTATRRGAHRPTPLTWLDTASGRYAVRARGDWLTVTPADAGRLTAMAQDLCPTPWSALGQSR